MLLAYKKAFIRLLDEITGQWIPKFEQYLNDPNGMEKEVQNLPEFIDGKVDADSTGKKKTEDQIRQLRKRIHELRQHSNDPNYKGDGRYKDFDF